MKKVLKVKFNFRGLGICLGILMVSKAYQCLAEGVKAYDDNRRQEKAFEKIVQTDNVNKMINELNKLFEPLQDEESNKRSDA